jgi:hypothetical protein
MKFVTFCTALVLLASPIAQALSAHDASAVARYATRRILTNYIGAIGLLWIFELALSNPSEFIERILKMLRNHISTCVDIFTIDYVQVCCTPMG